MLPCLSRMLAHTFTGPLRKMNCAYGSAHLILSRPMTVMPLWVLAWVPVTIPVCFLTCGQEIEMQKRVCCGQASHQCAGRAGTWGMRVCTVGPQVEDSSSCSSVWSLSQKDVIGGVWCGWIKMNSYKWECLWKLDIYGEMLLGISFYIVPSAVKLLLRDYKSIVFTVFMLHIKPVVFNLSFSPRETGQW